ncbi:hypothetical protein T439DRAFT_357497 [Meredithblackwellia eburnea MCA 4105]
MIIVILISAVTRAYIPAIAVNITIGTRTTPFKEVHLARPSSFFTGKLDDLTRAEVFQQVVADSAPNALYQKGIIMHFTEEQSDEPPSAVPWIALISCDSNGTTYSLTEEIFGIVSSKGAQAALMWSNYSTTCLLNQEVLYLNGYPRPLAVYTTGELAISKLIEAQILQLPTAAYTYSSKVLNDSINLAYRLLEGSNLKIPNEDPSSLTWTSPVATITSTATSLLGDGGGRSNCFADGDVAFERHHSEEFVRECGGFGRFVVGDRCAVLILAALATLDVTRVGRTFYVVVNAHKS